jgi:hypothetical protein
MSNETDLATWLGKQAAYRKSYLVRPKTKKRRRTTSHSKTYKVNTQKQKENEANAANTSTGNVQPPYRYGRRVK